MFSKLTKSLKVSIRFKVEVECRLWVVKIMRLIMEMLPRQQEQTLPRDPLLIIREALLLFRDKVSDLDENIVLFLLY